MHCLKVRCLMLQEQERAMERKPCRKSDFLRNLSWACSEELYDCHLEIDGALSRNRRISNSIGIGRLAGSYFDFKEE